MTIRTALLTVTATAVSAVVGSIGVNPESGYYKSLRKPRFQPPPKVFPWVWTPLYVDIAWATAVAADRYQKSGMTVERAALPAALGANLALNSGWCWLFFRAKTPWWSAVECAALTASSVDLVRRVWAADSLAGAALAPYAVWCAFATVLSSKIAVMNRGVVTSALD